MRLKHTFSLIILFATLAAQHSNAGEADRRFVCSAFCRVGVVVVRDHSGKALMLPMKAYQYVTYGKDRGAAFENLVNSCSRANVNLVADEKSEAESNGYKYITLIGLLYSHPDQFRESEPVTLKNNCLLNQVNESQKD